MKNFLTMKLVIQLAAITIFIFSISGCSFYEKHRRFSKGVDTLLDLKNEISQTARIDTQKVKIEPPITTSKVEEPQQKTGFGYGDEKYYMIVGCFLNQNLAEKYAEKVQQMGYHTQIIQSTNGYYRVSAQSYHSFKEGKDQVADYREKTGSKAWLHVRK
jgi:hypothetical protein